MDIDIIADNDNDGLTDFEEIEAGIDPGDADTDDDGVLDGLEANWTTDMDFDGLINSLDPDSDNDGLSDGLELSVMDLSPHTNMERSRYVRDDDPLSSTSMVMTDSDGDGIRDGAEDASYDGRRNSSESDPNNYYDSVELSDQDLDGLTNTEELLLGSDPEDSDSDEDGIADGDEWNWWDDHDEDGFINLLDPDSDGDGVLDGTERGITYAGEGTLVELGFFVADMDPQTTTQALIADTDGDSLSDGEEDSNGNGKVDRFNLESDPNDPNDPNTRCDHDFDCPSCEICVNGRCQEDPGCALEDETEQIEASDDLTESAEVVEVDNIAEPPQVGPPSDCGCVLQKRNQEPTKFLWLFILGLSVSFITRRRVQNRG